MLQFLISTEPLIYQHNRRNGMSMLTPGQRCGAAALPLRPDLCMPVFRNQCCLIRAGIDTTGHTGTWALYLLTQHPAAEARLAAELDAAELLVTAQRPHPRQLQWADLALLTYLQAVIKARPLPKLGVTDRITALDTSLRPHITHLCKQRHDSKCMRRVRCAYTASNHEPGVP